MAKATKTTKARKASLKDSGLLVSDRVEIIDVRLIASHAEQTPEAAEEAPKNIDLQRNVSVDLERKLKLILVFIDFSLTAQLEDTPRENPILQIHSKFLLTYRISSFAGLSKAAFHQFGEMNGVYNAWPYWREFIQNTTARMGIKPLTLPVFRIVSKSHKSRRNMKKKR